MSFTVNIMLVTDYNIRTWGILSLVHPARKDKLHTQTQHRLPHNTGQTQVAHLQHHSVLALEIPPSHYCEPRHAPSDQCH